MGSGAKSNMRMGFLIHKEMRKYFLPNMRRSLVIYDFAPNPSEFPNTWGKFYFLFISVTLTVLRGALNRTKGLKKLKKYF